MCTSTMQRSGRQQPPKPAIATLLEGDSLEEVFCDCRMAQNILAENAREGEESFTDSILSARLNSMSIMERTLGIYELHGVAVDNQEAFPRELKDNLRQTSNDIDTLLDTNDTVAYRYAKQMNKEYVEYIQQLCLRAESNDCQMAAARTVRFFTFKQSIFGKEKLGRPITLADLDEEDLTALKQGTMLLLSQRDSAGRAILMMIGARCHVHSAKSLTRVFYYTTMTALLDDETQKKGIVFILYSLGQNVCAYNRVEKLANVWTFLPIRLVAVHMCYDTKVMELMLHILSQAMQNYHLCRFRSHYGSFLECIFSLMTFGIPNYILPIDSSSGTIDLRTHHEWINGRRIREAQNFRSTRTNPLLVEKITDIRNPQQSSSSRQDTRVSLHQAVATEIIVPGPLDIVLGRGRHSNSSVGHLHFRSLMESRYSFYDKSKRADKMKAAKTVWEELRKTGCRFLRRNRDSGTLEECGELQSVEKVAHAFRNIRGRMLREKLSESSDSSDSENGGYSDGKGGTGRKRLLGGL